MVNICHRFCMYIFEDLPSIMLATVFTKIRKKITYNYNMENIYYFLGYHPDRILLFYLLIEVRFICI